MTDEHAERIASALESIAFSLSDDGPLADQLYLIRVILEEVAPLDADRVGRRFLRTIDISR